MSARFHLYLSGVFDRSRSCAVAVSASAASAVAMTRERTDHFMRPILAILPRMKWFVRGDIDGFFGLALDNLVQLLLVDALCRFVLGFPPELVYGRVLPGAAISILDGNLFYAYQARKLAERTGRTDICALPYGINTVSLIAHVFLVMLPAKALATAAGAPDPARIAWQAE